MGHGYCDCCYAHESYAMQQPLRAPENIDVDPEKMKILAVISKGNTMGDNKTRGDWTSTLLPEDKHAKTFFYDNDVKPFLDDLEDVKCEGCEDCDCEKAEPVKFVPEYTGHRYIDEFLHDTLEVMRKKGHDYRQGNDTDLLHNFRKVAEQVDEPMMKVWFTYFYKHYAALTTYIKNDGQSESEPIEGRITDMIVYLLLFHEMVRKKHMAEHGVIE